MVVHANRLATRTALPPRVGFVVSKAVGNAVVRGRTKRRLRAIAGARLSGIPDGLDIVVRAHPGAAQVDFDELSDAFVQALDKVCWS